jgi:hypothetical protein
VKVPELFVGRTLGKFLTITGDERNGIPLVEQGDNVGDDFEVKSGFGRDKLFEVLHFGVVQNDKKI